MEKVHCTDLGFFSPLKFLYCCFEHSLVVLYSKCHGCRQRRPGQKDTENLSLRTGISNHKQHFLCYVLTKETEVWFILFCLHHWLLLLLNQKDFILSDRKIKNFFFLMYVFIIRKIFTLYPLSWVCFHPSEYF